MDGSYELRTDIADVQYNSGGHSGSKIQEFIFGKSNPICEKYAKNSIAKKNKPKSYNTDEQPKKKKARKNYGDGHQEVDMTESQYDVAKARHIQRLIENQSDRIIIQIETRAQNHSFKWSETRRLMLTSSYFGRILNVRNRSKYTKIVEDILYKNVRYANTAEIRHQRIYEVEGLSIFCKLYPFQSIEKCGIFIDEEVPFLGASPFRLYGENGIIVMKCPKKEFGRSVEDARKSIPFWTGIATDRRINNKSHWYAEIQGQLHIAQKQMAYLMIYLGGDAYEIVEMEKNDDFWKKEMESELIYFYNEALLKELVNPREGRGMDLRKYNSKNEVFE